MTKVTIKGTAKNISKLLAGPFYIHTLDSIPASFFKGQGVLYSGRITAVRSLRQLRREQQEDRRIRTKRGIADTGRYGYRLVMISPVDRTRAATDGK